MKFLFRPIEPFVICQSYGENKACVDLATGRKVITCNGQYPPSGYRSIYGPDGHLGIDLLSSHGQPVYCAYGGVVDSIDTDPRTGLDVRIVSEVDGKRYRHIYEHLLGYQPKRGDFVPLGGLIGWADNTGYSSGDHLHFQLEVWENYWKPIDPLTYMHSTYALQSASVVKQVKEKLARIVDLLADLLRK